MRRISRQLREKAIASLKRAINAFNALDDDGRVTAVLLHLQHASEMLLKAGLADQRIKLFDKTAGRSIGFEKCLRLAAEHLSLSESDAGVLRAVDALRDDEQHWLSEISEELLFLHAQGAIDVLDRLMTDAFGDRLADVLPPRALPVASRPVQDFQVLIDSQFSQVGELLKPHRRQRADARARIRGLLALEAHASEDARVSERDVNRVERAIRQGKDVDDVFPRLRTVATEHSGTGTEVVVRFTKNEGAPVHFVPDQAGAESGAVREVDLQKKYHWSATELARKLDLTLPRATALRRSLSIDHDADCTHTFPFGGSRHIRYSDNALVRMRDVLEDPSVDMDEIWEEHRPLQRRK